MTLYHYTSEFRLIESDGANGGIHMKVYSRLLWRHEAPDFPVEVLSEYDSIGWEIRKVERFADGTTGFASESESSPGCELSTIQRPSDGDVVAEPEFTVTELAASEFERAWQAARLLSLVMNR